MKENDSEVGDTMDLTPVKHVNKRTFYPEILMWISDCLTVPRISSQDETYMFANCLVKYVEFFGVITGIHKLKGNSARYSVDDGTGTIVVLFNHSREITTNKYKNCVDLNSDLFGLHKFTANEHKVLQNLMNDMIGVYEQETNFRKLGDCVRVVGRLYDYRDDRNVNAYYLRVISMEEETRLISEIHKLYKHVYKFRALSCKKFQKM